MNNQKKTHELIRQNEQIVKKSQKHDANLQKNSTLYFQVGLIVCLLAAYGLLEMKFETTIPQDFALVLNPPDFTDAPVEKFKVYEEPKTEVKPEVVKKVLLTDKIKEVDNDFKMKEFVDIITSEQNNSSESPLDPSSINVEKITEEVNIPVAFIQNVPIYPGCENKKTNSDKRKCMSQKITKLIQRKFDGNDIASDYGLSGKQKIDIQFTIDKTGHVTNVITRSPHPKLDDEAERIINMIPEMTPGRQNNQNVGVLYSLPIVFQVQN
ncbi:energy transducer TonB [Thalassobellus suaedae]|uniref:Energy transducer TonB n=1 Tax=Thalassobellus suaedae TaxID=3074124 RepID=A0ABY9Y7U4_9FLAO|nr:energy transducer TonB [Flavobacteriaceae bacterium HL-DH10]